VQKILYHISHTRWAMKASKVHQLTLDGICK